MFHDFTDSLYVNTCFGLLVGQAVPNNLKSSSFSKLRPDSSPGMVGVIRSETVSFCIGADIVSWTLDAYEDVTLRLVVCR